MEGCHRLGVTYGHTCIFQDKTERRTGPNHIIIQVLYRRSFTQPHLIQAFRLILISHTATHTCMHIRVHTHIVKGNLSEPLSVVKTPFLSKIYGEMEIDLSEIS